MIWLILVGVGLGLASWAYAVNPACKNSADTVPQVWVTRGPYRWLRHPSYLGTWLYLFGLAGYGGGWAVALAVGGVAELLLRDWVAREKTALNAETERVTRLKEGDWYDPYL